MSLPNLLLGFVLSTLVGALFHLWKGGNLGHLLLYLLLAWIGFSSGHILAGQIGFTLVTIGTLHVGTAISGSLILLFAGHWLFVSGMSRTP